jgi:hypothetical protein
MKNHLCVLLNTMRGRGYATCDISTRSWKRSKNTTRDATFDDNMLEAKKKTQHARVRLLQFRPPKVFECGQGSFSFQKITIKWYLQQTIYKNTRLAGKNQLDVQRAIMIHSTSRFDHISNKFLKVRILSRSKQCLTWLHRIDNAHNGLLQRRIL